MMVIRGTAASNTAGVPTDANTMFPADRCSWIQGDAPDGNGYVVSSVFFYPGAGGTNSDVSITGAVLGYIGKSGRFVAITN